MDDQKFADTPIEPRDAQSMHPSGDFNCYDSEIYECCAPARFGQVGNTVRIIDYTYPSPISTLKKDAFNKLFNLYEQICNYAISHAPGKTEPGNISLSYPYYTFLPLASLTSTQSSYVSLAPTDHCLPVSYINQKNYQTMEWLSSLSDSSSQSSAPRKASSITTPSFPAGPARDNIRDYFKDDTTAEPEVNALSSSAIDRFGGAILGFPSNALQLTKETSRLPGADTQSHPRQYTPLSELGDECAVNVNANDSLSGPSYAPITGQIPNATALAVKSQDTVALRTCKEPRRSPRNSKSATAHAQTNFNSTKT
ncbi:hypothetical protein DL98DRAFT_247223 [Cadophora sp. DSE1049]|nr:hypothetical protein DL98DRAFT_247223 [Cadophora sp. DSE1049]